MKTAKHIEHLLRQGKKPKELVELGFPKQTVTRVRRQLEQGPRAIKSELQRKESLDGSQPQPSPPSEGEVPIAPQKLEAIERYLKELEKRVEALEGAVIESVSMEHMEQLLNGTPALNLRESFRCECGASGFVAIRIKCTSCGRENWHGWFPKQ